MTVKEAMEEVEKALTELRLKDLWGNVIEGIEAMPAVAKFHGHAWAENEERFYTGQINPKEYVQSQVLLIKEFGLDQFRRKADKVFTLLSKKDQGESNGSAA